MKTLDFSKQIKQTTAKTQRNKNKTQNEKQNISFKDAMSPIATTLRSMGQGLEREDGSKSMNHINLDINNFVITEVGDLQDQMDSMNLDSEADEDGNQTTPFVHEGTGPLSAEVRERALGVDLSE